MFLRILDGLIFFGRQKVGRKGPETVGISLFPTEFALGTGIITSSSANAWLTPLPDKFSTGTEDVRLSD
jgi:hypothetical protein